MPRRKKNHFDQKSGLYFIMFIVLVGLLLVYYFSQNSTETDEIDTNQVETSSTTTNNVNENGNVNGAINENENQNTNMDTGVGGGEIEEGQNSLGITVLSGQTSIIQGGDISSIDWGNGNNVSIMTLDYEGLVRNSISILSEEEIVVDGQTGVKLNGSSAKDGALVSLVLIEYNGKLYDFKGNDSFLNNLESFIKFN